MANALRGVEFRDPLTRRKHDLSIPCPHAEFALSGERGAPRRPPILNEHLRNEEKRSLVVYILSALTSATNLITFLVGFVIT